MAERLHTKQVAIARLEANTDGSLSLRRYVEYALACGFVPLEIAREPVEVVRKYIKENPQEARTKNLFDEWRKKIPG